MERKMDAGENIKGAEVVGEKRPRPKTPEEDVIDELYDGMDLGNDQSGAEVQGAQGDIEVKADVVADDCNDNTDGSDGDGDGDGDGDVRDVGDDVDGGLLGLVGDGNGNSDGEGEGEGEGTDSQDEDSEGDPEMNVDAEGEGELELQEEEGSPTKDANEIDNEATSSKGGEEADSEIDLEWELERGLQEASARNMMDSSGNTPTPSEDGGGIPLEKIVISGAQMGVIDNPDMLPPPAANVVEEDGGGELIEDVLLREVQEHGLTEAQLRRKEKEKHYAALLSTLHEKELDRYEAFRRSSLPRGKMRKLLMSISGQTINDEKVLIVVCSLAKMFVGELIEEARELATVDGYEGPILKGHIHRAYTQMEYEGRVKHRRMMKQFFKHL